MRHAILSAKEHDAASSLTYLDSAYEYMERAYIDLQETKGLIIRTSSGRSVRTACSKREITITLQRQTQLLTQKVKKHEYVY